MNEFMTSLLVVAAEIGAVIIIIFLIVMAILLIRRKKEVSVQGEFTRQYRESAKQRKENLGKEISKAFALNDVEGDNFANLILQKERLICSNVLRIFRGDDKSKILTVHEDLATLSGTYHEIASASSIKADSDEEIASDSVVDNDADFDNMTAEMHVLREENARLKEDLKKSLENVDYLQTQYTELFEKTNVKQNQK